MSCWTFGSVQCDLQRRRALTSFCSEEANASVNPAKDASILGLNTAMIAMAPITDAQSRQYLVMSQRFTGRILSHQHTDKGLSKGTGEH